MQESLTGLKVKLIRKGGGKSSKKWVSGYMVKPRSIPGSRFSVE